MAYPAFQTETRDRTAVSRRRQFTTRDKMNANYDCKSVGTPRSQQYKSGMLWLDSPDYHARGGAR
jgi:hypothetical protein